MKFKRFLAALLSALMIASCMSFVAGAQEEAELTGTGVVKEITTGARGGDGANVYGKYYDAVNDVLFSRIATAPGKVANSLHWDCYGFTFKVDDDGEMFGAYRMRSNEAGVTPKPKWKVNGSFSSKSGTAAIKGDETWETAVVKADGLTPGADVTQVQTHLLGQASHAAGTYLDVAIAVYANDQESAVAAANTASKYASPHNITFNLNYEGTENLDTYPTEIPNRVADGYIFEGWSTKADATEDEVEYKDLTCVAVPEADTTYYAVWGDLIEEGNAVYISADGSDENGGRHSKNAVATIEGAEAILKAAGNEALNTIYIVGAPKLSTGKINFGVPGKKVYIEGYTGNSDIFDITSGHIRFNGDVEFNNVTIAQVTGSGWNDGGFMAQGHNITIGDNIIVTGLKSFAQYYYTDYGEHYLGASATSLADAVATFKSGTWTKVHIGTYTAGPNFYGKSTINVSDAAIIEDIRFGHNSDVGFYGTFAVNVNGGSVGEILMNYNGKKNSYSGVRYFTINDGTVGSIYITPKVAATTQTGVTVVEVNKAGALTGNISKGAVGDSSKRTVIYNNDSYVAGQVTDADAVVLNVNGATVKAKTNATVNSDGSVTTTFDGYTYALKNDSYDSVLVNGNAYALADGILPTSYFGAGVNDVVFFDSEAEHITEYKNKGYNVVYVSANGAENADGATIASPKKADSFASAFDAALTGNDKTVIAVIGELKGNANVPVDVDGADVIITSAIGANGTRGGYINFYSTNGNYDTILPKGESNYTFDNIYIKVGGSGQSRIYASGANVKLTSSVTSNTATTGSGLTIAHGRDSADAFTGGTIDVNTSLYLLRSGAGKGNNITGDIIYNLGENAVVGLIGAGGHAGNSAGTDAGTLKGSAYINVNGATLKDINPAYMATVTGDVIVNVNNGGKIEALKTTCEGDKGVIKGDYVIYLNDGTIGAIAKKATPASGCGVKGKTILIVNDNKADVPTSISDLPYLVSFSGNGEVTYDTATDKLVLTAGENAKFVKVTNGDSSKVYNLAGDEVTLMAEGIAVDLAAGTTTVEFLTEGTAGYTVTFVDGEKSESNLVAEGTVPTAPAWTKTGYTLSWDEEITAVTGDITYTAVWTANKHNVIYTLDGEEYKKAEYAYGANVEILAAPEAREGYTFSGWSVAEAFTMPNEDVTITGTFTINSYTVTYYVNSEEVKKDTYTYGAEVTAYEYTAPEGYTFSGWDKEIPTTMPAENLEISGTTTANKHNVIYIVDGEEYNKTEYAYGATVEILASPEKEGYIFSGWSVTEAFTMPDEDVTITGTFTKNAPTVPTYKTYGKYDAMNDTYIVELKFVGAKVNQGSFGFAFPTDSMTLKSVEVNEEAGLELLGAGSRIYANENGNYADTWVVSGENFSGNVDATNEEVLIATFKFDMTKAQREAFTASGKTIAEYVVASPDEKYHDGTNYLATPYATDFSTTKAPITYASHADEEVSNKVEYFTYGKYDAYNETYTIDIKVKGAKINLGAFGLAFNGEYMTFDPEVDENGDAVNVEMAEGIANYLNIILNNTADGYAFAFDGSNQENGYVDASDEEVLIATITLGMTKAQREAFVNAGKTMEIYVPADVDAKYFDGENYIANLYTNGLEIPKVKAEYVKHEDTALEVTLADAKVTVTFASKVGATSANIATIKLGDDEAIALEEAGNTEATLTYTFKALTIGETYKVTVEKNGYIAGTIEFTAEAENEIAMTLLAGDIKGSTTATSGDGTVNLDDFVRLIRAFDAGASNEFKATVDLDESGVVNVTDLSVLKTNYNKTSADNTVTFNGK